MDQFGNLSINHKSKGKPEQQFFNDEVWRFWCSRCIVCYRFHCMCL